MNLKLDGLPKMQIGRFLGGVTAGFYIEDPDLQAAIRARAPEILDILNLVLDKYQEIAALMDLGEGGIDLERAARIDPSGLERQIWLALQSEYASDSDRQRCFRMLRALQQQRRKEIKASLVASRRSDFQRKQPQLMLALIDRDSCECKQCGSQDDLTIDHIIPLSRGGSDDLDNLQLLCQSCNSQKRNH